MKPFLQFLLLGGLLFLVRTATQRAPSQPAPGDEELLYRAAVASGLDRGSEVVNQRLIDNMRFLEGGEAKGRDGGKLYNEAVALGFDRTDPVVRRVLVEQMRLVAEAGYLSGPRPEAPTEAELADYLRRHKKRFRQPGQVRLSHVFLDADRRGAALESDASRLLCRLQAGRITPEAAPALGDPFLPGHHPALATPRDLAKIYGPAFARALSAVPGLPAGRWLGPVSSTYGLHLVWIHQSVPGAPATLAEVRNQVVLGLANERREARLAAFLRGARPSPPSPISANFGRNMVPAFVGAVHGMPPGTPCGRPGWAAAADQGKLLQGGHMGCLRHPADRPYENLGTTITLTPLRPGGEGLL